jgi:hypothetical protein
MRPVMTITIHIGYTEGSLSRELSLPGGPEVGTSTPRQRKVAVYRVIPIHAARGPGRP